MPITRRGFISKSTAYLTAMSGFAGYAFGIEPRFRLNVTRYAFTPPNWTLGLKLKIAALSDIHASEPYMSMQRLSEIVTSANALQADIIVLLGDYVVSTPGLHFLNLSPALWAAELAKLKAPLGVFAILGNHDWWQYGFQGQLKSSGEVIQALKSAGAHVLHNDGVRLEHNGKPFWLLGLGDQLAYRGRFANGARGADDLPLTLSKLTDNAPAILLAHEPDIFVDVPSRISVTMSGHTHGGQVRLFGWSPVIPSRYGNRFSYGHIVESERHLLVTGGLGVSSIPIRIGMPPEIMLVELG